MKCLHLVTAGAILLASVAPAQAQRADRYLGEIFMVGMNFCPRGTLEADGALLEIRDYTALFALYGTSYGGDGRTSFALPDLSGRAPIGQGASPDGSPIEQGQQVGRPVAATGKPDSADQTGSEAPAEDEKIGDGSEPENTGESTAGTEPSHGLTGLAVRFCVAAQGNFPARP